LRVPVTAPPMTAQVAIEGRADVAQLVEQRDELLIEGLIAEARQADGHKAEHPDAVEKVALPAAANPTALPGKDAPGKAQGGDPRLQPAGAAATGLRHAEQQPGHIDMGEVLAMADHVSTQAANVGGEIERLAGRAGPQPGRCLQ